MELTREHLQHYPMGENGLKLKWSNTVLTLDGVAEHYPIIRPPMPKGIVKYSNVMPLLHPLSYLKYQIEVTG